MKNFVKYLLIISILLMPLQVTAAENSENTQYVRTVQMTDYRYENGIRLTGGYTLLNYYEPISFKPLIEGYSVREPNDKPPLPSTVLNPDGTELFKPGDIYLNYEFITQTTEKGGGPSVYLFPQNATQDGYIVNNINTGKYGIMNEWGRIITDCIYDDISQFSGYLFKAQKDKSGIHENDYCIINSKTGKEIFTYEDTHNVTIYVNNDNTKIMCCSHYTDDGSGVNISRYDYTIYDDKGNILISGELKENHIKNLAENNTVTFDYTIYDNKGNMYDKGEYNIENNLYKSQPYYRFIPDVFEKLINVRFYNVTPTFYPADKDFKYSISPEDKALYYKETFDFLNLSAYDGISDSVVDQSYRIEPKDIGGKTYYAVFKDYKSGEPQYDYMTLREKPLPWSFSYVYRLIDEGLLFNESLCRYTDNISRKDFAFLAVRAFCKAQGMEVDEYIKANNITLDYNKFTDTEDSYILLANYLGIVDGTSETTFSPARGITRQEAAVMLNNMAKLLGLSPNSERVNFTDSSYFADWAADAIYSISSIKPPLDKNIMSGTEPGKFSPWMTYTREQAYVTICRLYNAAKKK